MSRLRFLILSLPALAVALTGLSLPAQAPALQRRQWTVDGVIREALVHVPANAREKPSPLVFGFHGHGGSMANAARSYRIHALWPEAAVVYPQGLNTPGQLTDPEGKKPGWQHSIGELGDRDLKFFDVMLATMKTELKVDTRRVYSTGHSNGGGFTYMLWAARGEVFAAMAPSASAAGRVRGLLKPKPVLHIAGENDELVKYSWQQAMIASLLALNQCGESRPWELDDRISIHPSKVGCPVLTAIHPGTHKYPAEAPEVIVKFFKSHPAEPARENEGR